MLDRYYKITEKQIICGQSSNGNWYCKELPANNTIELRVLIGEVNKILNEYNKLNGKETKPKKKKETPSIKNVKM